MTHAAAEVMRGFWDAKARENAPFYIATRARFWRADMDEFFASGAADLEQILARWPVHLADTDVALEVGCGIGRMTHALAGKVKEIHAVDIAPSMIEQARTLHAAVANAHFHLGSGADLALFPDASFDFVFSFIVLQHIPDPDVVLSYIREFGRVLRPGGRALFQLRTHPESPDQAPPPSFDSAMVELLFGSGYDSPAWIGSTLHMQQVREAIGAARMTLIDVDGVGSQYTWLHCRTLSTHQADSTTAL